MNIQIKQLSQNHLTEFIELIKIFELVFEWDNSPIPNPTHLQNLLKKDHFLTFIATDSDKTIGGLTAHVLERYDSEKPSAYLYDIAILPEMQRKGIGKKLLTFFNQYCKQNGFHETFVQAETDDIQAVNFYKTTPISSELNATHFTYTFDEKTQ